MAGRDFGDFIVWRKDDLPAYQLAVVTDDAAMQITEVVRGEDLLTSTFRQLLLYGALGFSPPAFFHGALVREKRRASREAPRRPEPRALRASGSSPEALRQGAG